jgi:hypothetical protein
MVISGVAPKASGKVFFCGRFRGARSRKVIRQYVSSTSLARPAPSHGLASQSCTSVLDIPNSFYHVISSLKCDFIHEKQVKNTKNKIHEQGGEVGELDRGRREQGEGGT